LSSRRAAIPYILPYGVFIALLGIQTFLPLSVAVRFLISMAAICAVSLPLLRGVPSRPFASIAVGLITFVIWVGPDVILPSWHHFILFDNSIVGHPAGNTPPASKNDPVFLFFRIAISVIAVPILEELFWRGWLIRWIEATTHHTYDFRNIPLGQFGAGAFWSVAVLFAVEHGSFWDVGLVTGIIFNWWMSRTRNLWDCILMHAVTNAALAAYVVLGGHWQYWL
jgi:hypothetical protein